MVEIMLKRGDTLAQSKNKNFQTFNMFIIAYAFKNQILTNYLSVFLDIDCLWEKVYRLCAVLGGELFAYGISVLIGRLRVNFLYLVVRYFVYKKCTRTKQANII